MPKQTSRKKTTGRRIKGAGGNRAIINGLLDKYVALAVVPYPDAVSTEANFPFFNGAVAGYEKWARETLAGKTGPFKRESAEWFAAGMIRYVEEIRFYLAESGKDRATKEAHKGEAIDRATWTAFRLGNFVQRMKEEVFGNGAERDKNIISGVMQRVANQKRRKEQVIKAAPKTAALHKDIRTAAAGMGKKSKWSKAEVLARKFDLSSERIRRII